MDDHDNPAGPGVPHPVPERDRSRLLGRQRHAHILDQLAAAGSVTVSVLAEALDVSDMTIRRDLLELEGEGRLRRIHGGAVPPDSLPPVSMDSEEPSFDARLRQRRAAKEAVAAAAAAIVAKYRTIALDVGTTTFLMAGHLKGLQHAKIFTNSLRIAAALDGVAPDVYVAGGRLRPDEMSTFGPSAVAQFEALWFDVAVIGVSGITAEGLFDYSFEDADLKRVYLRRSGLKIVVCDSAKFQRMSLVHIAPLPDINVLITDAEPPERLAAVLAASRVEVRIARPPAGA
ncbi:DeoR/GlpR family DNA-binding transcription regulator [Phreatobacter stygius]|uniref:DeoR/GlpR transcriptional regulator n=1 Tax=Phreatobacter stygius TaxID=1940610 RepID=A0A4D7BH34_9HYPH|nr:DeoR/GlpR family DNA-binding transcription regulator [Phreatobacter stygius]QCI67107.1 DeoR/GlpR transcriptional regulator [Phreatobacter stygius]